MYVQDARKNVEHKCLRRGVRDGTWNPYTRRFSETRRILSVIGAVAAGEKRLGTTAHVTLEFPCAWGAMHYMLTTSIS